jgi:hypothetical protein
MGIALRRCTQRWRDVVPRRLLGGQEHAEHASVLGRLRKLWIERRLQRCLGLRRREIITGYFWYFDLRVSGRPEGRSELNIYGLNRDWPYRITCEGTCFSAAGEAGAIVSTRRPANGRSAVVARVLDGDAADESGGRSYDATE